MSALATGDAESGTSGFVWKAHGKFLQRFLVMLPDFLSSLDTQRPTIAFFAVSGLDLLGKLDELMNPEAKQRIVDWLYSLQIKVDEPDQAGGFRGGPFLGNAFDCGQHPEHHHTAPPTPPSASLPGDAGHLAMTYTAMATLAILGDSLTGLDRRGIVNLVRATQQADGSFRSMPLGGETDLRFTYCACCVSRMLGDWSGVDIPRAAAFVRGSLSYEGALGQGPLLESHAGSTFCGVAALVMMNELEACLSEEERARLLRWLVNRQQTGFNGRPNKLVDACYSFWVGSTLALLGATELVDRRALRAFLLLCESTTTGGFGKDPEAHPDPLHSYMSLAGLSLQGEPGLAPLDPVLNISQRAAARFKDTSETAAST